MNDLKEQLRWRRERKADLTRDLLLDAIKTMRLVHEAAMEWAVHKGQFDSIPGDKKNLQEKALDLIGTSWDAFILHSSSLTEAVAACSLCLPKELMVLLQKCDDMLRMSPFKLRDAGEITKIVVLSNNQTIQNFIEAARVELDLT